MLRLLKWATVAAMAYVVYEIFSALTRSDSPVAAVSEALGEQEHTGPILSGPAQGATVGVHDSDGSEHRQVVGRGVVRR